MPYDPDADGPYADWLKGKGVHARPSGWTDATRDQVVEGQRDDGTRFKTVRDQLGNDVTDRTGPDGRERRDVRINLR